MWYRTAQNCALPLLLQYQRGQPNACPSAASPPFLPSEHSLICGEGECSGPSALLALQCCSCAVPSSCWAQRTGALKVPQGLWVRDAVPVLLLTLGKGWEGEIESAPPNLALCLPSQRQAEAHNSKKQAGSGVRKESRKECHHFSTHLTNSSHPCFCLTEELVGISILFSFSQDSFFFFVLTSLSWRIWRLSNSHGYKSHHLVQPVDYP